MSLFNPYKLRAALGRHQRVLGIDPGSVSVGLALSDVSLMLASPYRVIKRQKLGQMVAEISAMIAAEGVGALVCGLPLSMNGEKGPAAQAAEDWLRDLSSRLDLPACCWDERLSSSAVNRFLIEEADMTRKRRAAVVDKMAASYMLQGWLDATRGR